MIGMQGATILEELREELAFINLATSLCHFILHLLLSYMHLITFELWSTNAQVWPFYDEII